MNANCIQLHAGKESKKAPITKPVKIALIVFLFSDMIDPPFIELILIEVSRFGDIIHPLLYLRYLRDASLAAYGPHQRASTDDPAIQPVENRDNFRNRGCRREVSIPDGGQGDDHEVNRVQPTSAFQPMKKRRANPDHQCRVQEDRACPGIKE